MTIQVIRAPEDCGLRPEWVRNLTMSAEIRRRLLNLENLPSPPALAVELLELAARDDVHVRDIAALIERDPALTAKLLRLCNSASFGLRQRVSSIERATVMLGLKPIKHLALGLMIVRDSQARSGDGFDHQNYWRRASVTAVSARTLAEQTLPTLSGEGFVCGLLLDIGQLLLQQVAPQAYREVIRSWAANRQPLHEVEESSLGITHMEAGQILLESWGLPEVIHVPVGFHHRAAAYPGQKSISELVRIVSAASEIADLFCGVDKAPCMDRVMGLCRKQFHFGEREAHTFLKSVGDDAQETAWMFEIKSPESLSFQNVLQQVAKPRKRMSQTV